MTVSPGKSQNDELQFEVLPGSCWLASRRLVARGRLQQLDGLKLLMVLSCRPTGQLANLPGDRLCELDPASSDVAACCGGFVLQQ